MPSVGANEVLRSVVGLLLFVNIACFFYYVVVHRPAQNTVLQTQRVNVARIKEVSKHAQFSDSIRQAALDWEVEESQVAHDRTIGAAYYQAHGLSHGDLPWWSVPTNESTSFDHERTGEQAQGAVAFAGGHWLPWLMSHNLSTIRTGSRALPLRIRRSTGLAVPRCLVVPSMALGHFSLNGTVPLHYRTHFRLPSSRLNISDVEESDPPVSINSSYHNRRHIPRKRLVDMLTSILNMVHHPHYDASTRGARMQRSFVLAIKSLRTHIAGRDVLVVGSLSDPFVEVVMLAIGGAKRVVSVDYVPFRTTDRRIVSMSPGEFWRCVDRGRRQCPSYLPEGFRIPTVFPVVVAYSAVQHDGLGRYGDPVDPFGDVKLMWELRSLLAPDPSALLLLGVPLGNDCLVFNRHRVYGRRRLPLLLLGFEVYQTHGFDLEVPDVAAGVTFGESWAHDNRCLGDSQRVPLLVLQTAAAYDTTEQGAHDSVRLLPPGSTRSWFRVPGLAGPFPLHT